MAFYLSPLVDVNEIDLSTTIPAVATSIGVIVLRNTFKGPENKQTLVADEADLIRAFGEPTDTSYEDLMSATGFLKFGNKLYCTRVLPDDARFSSIAIDDAGSGAAMTTGGIGLTFNYGLGVVATTDPVVIEAGGGTLSDGTYDNVGAGYPTTTDGTGSGCTVQVDVSGTGTVVAFTVIDGGTGYVAADTIVVTESLDFSTTDVGLLTSATATLVSPVDGVISEDELQLVDGGSRYEATQTYTVVDVGSTSDAVITVDTIGPGGDVLTYTITNGGSGYSAAVLELELNDGQADWATGTLDDLASGDPDEFGDEISVAAGNLVYTIGMSRGLYGDDIRIAFLDKADQTTLLQGGTPVAMMPSESFAEIDSQLDKVNDFLVLVQAKDQRKNSWVTKESFNVSTDTNALDDTGTTRFVEQVVNQTSQYIRMAVSVDMLGDEDSGVDTELAILSNDMWFQLDDGFDGTGVADDGNIINGYRLYENPEEIDVNLIIDSGKTDTVKLDLVAMCEERLDCMTVLDCPKADVLNNKGNEAVDLRTWRNSTLPSSSYASVYGNWLEVYDKFNQKYRWIPASGFVTGVFAKTDDVRDPWWAPAGLNRAILTSVRRLAWNPKMGYRDILYSNGINPIVTFPGEGKVIWGQKTLLSKESAFNRINVRRLFLVLEKAIATSAKYFLFEPNDNATRNLLVNMISPFLRDVQARRGIYDFKVVCDDTNNTPARVDRNELWCNIFIKPTRTAEFIVLNFVATATGASFEEAAAAV